MKEVKQIELQNTTLRVSEKVTEVVYASNLNLDFLSMSVVEFYDNVQAQLLRYVDKETDERFDRELSDVLDGVMVHQTSDSTEGGSEKDFFTYVGNSKMTPIHLPIGIDRVVLTFIDDTTKTIDVSEHDDCDRLMMLIESNSELNNISPMIHEKSERPHVMLDRHILVCKRLWEERQVPVFKNLVDTRNNIRIGNKVIPVEFSMADTGIQFPDNCIYWDGVFVTFDNELTNYGKVAFTVG